MVASCVLKYLICQKEHTMKLEFVVVRAKSFLTSCVFMRVFTSARLGLPQGKCSCWPYAHPLVSEARWAPARIRSWESQTKRSGPRQWSQSQLSGRSSALVYGSMCRPSGLLGTEKNKVQEYKGKRGNETNEGTGFKRYVNFSLPD